MKGFERPVQLIRTNRANMRPALDSVDHQPGDSVLDILAVTVPTTISAEEFTEPASDFVASLKDNPEIRDHADYNRLVGSVVSDRMDAIQAKFTDLRVCNSYTDLIAGLAAADLPEDITLCLTVVAHALPNGSAAIEFPDRPEGVTAEELRKDIAKAFGNGEVNIELNLIVCTAGQNMTRELLPSARVITAPANEIRPDVGLDLYRRALELRKPGHALWEATTEAYCELLRHMIEMEPEHTSPSEPYMEGPGSFPSPEARNAPHHPLQKDLSAWTVETESA